MNDQTTNLEQIYLQAKERIGSDSIEYSGLLTPQEAYTLTQNQRGVIVDVRTRAEWLYVGRIPNALEIQWLLYPDMSQNPNFLKELQKVAPCSTEIYFICRSGQRSHFASVLALTNGWKKVFNVIEGFEGIPDQSMQRNSSNGWKFHQLPWYQS